MLTATELLNHPLQVAQVLIAEHPDIQTFYYHVYRYLALPGSASRFIEHDEMVPVNMMTPRHIIKRLDKLELAIPEVSAPPQDLALRSTVILDNGRHWHIPQVDFAMTEPNKAVFDKVRQAASDLFDCTDLMIYRSGHSFHGYIPTLTTQSGWYQWMSRLLLISEPNTVPAVDVRWVGHQLRNQWSSLRWSYSNREHYIGIPQRYEET